MSGTQNGEALPPQPSGAIEELLADPWIFQNQAMQTPEPELMWEEVPVERRKILTFQAFLSFCDIV